GSAKEFFPCDVAGEVLESPRRVPERSRRPSGKEFRGGEGMPKVPADDGRRQRVGVHQKIAQRLRPIDHLLGQLIVSLMVGRARGARRVAFRPALDAPAALRENRRTPKPSAPTASSIPRPGGDGPPSATRFGRLPNSLAPGTYGLRRGPWRGDLPG